MATKHAITSAAPASADPGKIDGPKWNETDHIVDTGGMTMEAATATPATPAAGKMVLFARSVGGRALPAVVGSQGPSTSLQPYIARNKIGYWSAMGDNNSAPTNVGLLAPAGGTSTLTTRGTSTANAFTMARRLGYVSAGTAGASCGVRSTIAQFARGTSAGVGGFTNVWRFGVSDAATVADARLFCGLIGSVNVIGNVNPSTLTNIIGLGADSGDANLSIMHNDATGSAVKVALGANFPANTSSTDLYELALYCAPGSSEIGWLVTRLNTGDTAGGAISTEMPAQTALLAPQLWRNNGTTALAVAVDFVSMYIETDT